MCFQNQRMQKSPIRLVISGIPPLLRNVLLDAIREQSDIEVAAEEEDIDAMLRIVSRIRPDAVLMGCSRAEVATIAERLVETWSGVKLIAIVGDGRDIELLDLCPRRVSLGSRSASGVIRAVREAVVGRSIAASF